MLSRKIVLPTFSKSFCQTISVKDLKGTLTYSPINDFNVGHEMKDNIISENATFKKEQLEKFR